MNEHGQGLVEYALLLLLISIIVIVILTILGNQLSEMFQSVVDFLNSTLAPR